MTITDNYLDQVASITHNFKNIRDAYSQKYLPAVGNISFDKKYHYSDSEQSGTLKENILNDKTINKMNINYDGIKTLADGAQDDINSILIQENNIYIIGSIAISTLLVLAIIIGKE